MSSFTSPPSALSDVTTLPLSPLWIKSDNCGNMDLPNCNGMPERKRKLSFSKPLTPVNGTERRMSIQWSNGAPPSPCAMEYLDSTNGRRGSRRCSLLRELMVGYTADAYSNDSSASDFGISYSNKEDVINTEPPTPLTVTTSRNLTLPDLSNSSIGMDASGGEPDIFSDYGSASEKSYSNTPRSGSAVLPPDDPMDFLPQLFPNFFTQLEAAVTEGINVAAATGVPPTSPQVRQHAVSTSYIPHLDQQVVVPLPTQRVVMPTPPKSTAMSSIQRRTKKRSRPRPRTSVPVGSKCSSAKSSETVHTAQLGQKKCSYCHKTFLCESKLQRHLRTHTGEKPFACLCEHTFTQKSSLKTHIMRHAAMKHKKGQPYVMHGPKKMTETGHTMA